jgi:hypothetical protein
MKVLFRAKLDRVARRQNSSRFILSFILGRPFIPRRACPLLRHARSSSNSSKIISIYEGRNNER